jgi:hypothetical protein
MDPDEPCVICGVPADDPHHYGGRNHESCYLDPHATAPVCHDDHELLGDDMRAEGLEAPCVGTTVLEELAHRMEGFAVLMARVAEVRPDDRWLANLASASRIWADDAHELVRRFDELLPDWRAVDGA